MDSELFIKNEMQPLYVYKNPVIQIKRFKTTRRTQENNSKIRKYWFLNKRTLQNSKLDKEQAPQVSFNQTSDLVNDLNSILFKMHNSNRGINENSRKYNTEIESRAKDFPDISNSFLPSPVVIATEKRMKKISQGTPRQYTHRILGSQNNSKAFQPYRNQHPNLVKLINSIHFLDSYNPNESSLKQNTDLPVVLQNKTHEHYEEKIKKITNQSLDNSSMKPSTEDSKINDFNENEDNQKELIQKTCRTKFIIFISCYNNKG